MADKFFGPGKQSVTCKVADITFTDQATGETHTQEDFQYKMTRIQYWEGIMRGLTEKEIMEAAFDAALRELGIDANGVKVTKDK